MRRSLAVVLLGAALAGTSPAQDRGSDWGADYPEKAEALRLVGNPKNGETAFEICQGCHRVGALGREDGSYPRLAGQHARVVVKQLADVRSNRRNNPKMMPFADHLVLSVQDIADIAAYLEALPVPPDHGRGDGAAVDLGRQRYERDCRRCHGARGEGNAMAFYPRLAGQHYRYLLREGKMIRDGQRRNGHPEMLEAIRDYSDNELSAVADYVSRLPAAAR